MVSRIQKWGSSQGVRISKDLLEKAGIAVGDEVHVSARAGRIIVEPVSKLRGHYDLKKLLARIPKNYRAAEIDWGEPSGREFNVKG